MPSKGSEDTRDTEAGTDAEKIGKPGKAGKTGKKAKAAKARPEKIEYLPSGHGGPGVPSRVPLNARGKLDQAFYEKELARLQVELIKLQEWVRLKGLRVCVIFEGRDAAGKGGVIKRIVEHLNPRVCSIVALPKPSERERTQWYFQRYVAHLPAAGEIVFFDRSWYNRSGVERVMGFCTEEEHAEFLRSAPEFERMLLRSGIILLKYWFSVSAEEQERRFLARLRDPKKHWKLSPMDLKSRELYEDYSRAKDETFAYTHTPQSPWYVVPSDDKLRARLNCIHHLLSRIPYEDITPHITELPPRPKGSHYIRPPVEDQCFVPAVY